jgi:ATP-dependent Lhr-like helicase
VPDRRFRPDGLIEVQRQLAARKIRLVEVETREPSPFAKSLLFGYVGAFVYEGDVPLAEKKAAALSLDASLLAELLGKDGLRQLLDPGVIAATEDDLQGRSEHRRAGTTEQLFDLLRTAGPFTPDELAERVTPDVDVSAALTDLAEARRVVRLRIAGREMAAVVEDVPRLRDGLGVPVPPGVAATFESPSSHPIQDLVLRWARTHGPFTASAIARRYGLGRAVVAAAGAELVRSGQVVRGSFIDPGPAIGDDDQLCHTQVLALIKRRSLAALRREVEPVEQVAYARFLAEWQGVGSRSHGTDAVLSTLEQLAGYAMPASAVESMVLPARVEDYRPAMLDELTSAGEVFWVGDGAIGDSDGWVRFHLPGADPPAARGDVESAQARRLLEAFSPGGAYFFDGLLPGDAGADRTGWVAALWQLVWAGLVSSDTFTAVRNLTGGGAHKTVRKPISRSYRGRPRIPRPGRGDRPARLTSPTTVGRWSLVASVTQPASARLADAMFTQLDRYGVVTRGSVLTESVEGGFGTAYRALSALEESGQCRRGYFIEGLGAAQFASTGAVDRLRSEQNEPSEARGLTLAACDPANPYGAALPWPEREGHRPGRKPGALVTLVNGRLVFYVERGGRTLLSFTDDADLLTPAAAALARAVRLGQLGRLTVERADGRHVFGSAAVSTSLQQAGFVMSPSGLRLRPAPS